MDSYKFLQIFFEELNINKTKYAVLRNYNDLPRKWGNDIDIIIENEKKAILIVFKLLKKYNYQNEIIYRKHFSLISIILYFKDRELRLDFYNSISFAWIQYVKNEVIFQYVKKSHKNFYYLDKDISNILILVKEYFAYREIRKKYANLYFDDKSITFRYIDYIFGNSFTKSTKKKIWKLCYDKNYKFFLLFYFLKYFNLKKFIFWLFYRIGKYQKLDLNSLRKKYDG